MPAMGRGKAPIIAVFLLASAMATGEAHAQSEGDLEKAVRERIARSSVSDTGRTVQLDHFYNPAEENRESVPSRCSYVLRNGQRRKVYCGSPGGHKARYRLVIQNLESASSEAARGNHTAAALLYRKAIESVEHRDGAISTAAILPLDGLGAALVKRGAYRLAERAWEVLVPLLEAQRSGSRAALPDFVIDLAWRYQALGLFRRARALWPLPMELDVGRLSQHRARMIFVHRVNKGFWHFERGEHARAESAWVKALEHGAKHLKARPIARAIVGNALGGLYRARSQTRRAEEQWQNALGLLAEAGYQGAGPAIAVLGNLVELYHRQGRARAAGALLERIMSPRNRDPGVAVGLGEVAGLYMARGEYEVAATLYREALAIFTETLGESALLTAEGLYNLGAMHAYAGQHARAKPYLERALVLMENDAAPSSVAATLMNLAWVSAETDESARALERWARANQLLARAVEEAADARYSQLAGLSNVSESVSFHLKLMPANSQAARQAMASILQHKGRALEAVAMRYRALQLREEHELFKRLGRLRSRLASAIYNGAALRPIERRAEIAHLGRQISMLEEKLENELQESSGRPPSLADVLEALPAGSVVVEYVVYYPFELTHRGAPPGLRWGEPRYAAYVADAHGRARGLDLGPVASIDELVMAFRDALSSPDRGDVRILARALYDRVMAPVRAMAGDAHTYYVAPDGSLALAPLQALVDERGRYLVEYLSLDYIDSARDLVRPPASTEAHGVVIVADPAFDAIPGDASRKQAGNAGHSPYMAFPPLRSTAIEARSIAAMVSSPGSTRRDGTVLLGAEARESALKGLKSPRVLHVATHGFFFDGRPLSPVGLMGRRAVRMTRARPRVVAENPLLQSGIALAGANRVWRWQKENDGILTALEAALLRLEGTKLVVLSACDTGLGQATVGDGVYGLRRALRIAGAETVVMSLWKVSDADTKDLMLAYYYHLGKGAGRGEALRAAQLEFLADARRSHPFYWAAFIASGDARALEADSGATYLTGKTRRQPIDRPRLPWALPSLELYLSTRGRIPARAASNGETLRAAVSFGAAAMLRMERGVRAGLSIDASLAQGSASQVSVGARLGKELRFDALPWLHPEVMAELGVTRIRNLGSIARLIFAEREKSVTLPYAGLRLGAFVDLDPSWSLGLWVAGRQSLGTREVDVFDRNGCDSPECIVESWSVGGRTLDVQLSLRHELSW